MQQSFEEALLWAAHGFVLAPGQGDPKVWNAALKVSCEPMSGGYRCR